MAPKFKIKAKFRRGRAGEPYAQTKSKSERKQVVPEAVASSSATTDVTDISDQDVQEPAASMSDSEDDLQGLMSPGQHYGHLLHVHDYLAVWDANTAFVIYGYNEEKRSVETGKYFFLERKVVHFSDGYQWVYQCSCNPFQGKYICSLGDTQNQSLSIVIQTEKCLHVKGLEVCLSFYDLEHGIDLEEQWMLAKATDTEPDHSYSGAQDSLEVSFKTVPGGSSFIGVAFGDSRAVCTISYTKINPPTAMLKCTTCALYDCRHVNVLHQALEQYTEDDPSILSEFKLSYETTPEMRTFYENCVRSARKIPLYTEGECGDGDFKRKTLVPTATGECDQCQHNWCSGPISDEWIEMKTCWIGCMYSLHEVCVYFRPCSNCPNRKHYDGFEDSLLWYGQYGLSHAVLKDYIRHFLLCKLLDIDYKEGFHCTLCGVVPDKVVLDGTALGLQKTFMPTDTEQQAEDKVFDGRFESRNFINRKACRELLKKYCFLGLTESEFDQLKNDVPSKGLCNLLKAFAEEGFWNKCPSSYRPLFVALSSDQAVCALVPPSDELATLLLAIGDGMNPKEQPQLHMKMLQDQIPCLFDLLASLEEVPQQLRDIIKELVEKSKAPFCEKGVEKSPHPLVPVSDSSAYHSSVDSHFPCLPQMVLRGKYIQDNVRTNVDECAKLSFSRKRHSTLIPGLFTLNCVHGVCYGFQFMRHHESPNIPYTIIRTRFPTAPSVIIYDLACKLHLYALNRDPAFFRNSKFLVDKFHWKNHKGCSEAYKMTRYEKFNSLNSQVAEQINSNIKPLSSMLCYMRHENFVLFIKFHLWHRNMLHKFKSVPDGNFAYKFVFMPMTNLPCK